MAYKTKGSDLPNPIRNSIYFLYWNVDELRKGVLLSFLTSETSEKTKMQINIIQVKIFFV